MNLFSKIAKLANLPDSKAADTAKLEETIKYVEVLKGLDTKNIVPTFQVGNSTNHLREDVVEPERIILAGKYQTKISWT